MTDPKPNNVDVESVIRLMAQTWPERHDDLVELKVSLGVMGEQIRSLTRQITTLSATLEKSKTPWWQFWGPIAFCIATVGGVYKNVDDKIDALALSDQRSLTERGIMAAEILKLRDGVKK